ncbi:hypothetical protein D9M70_546150 [compost metagenome]
MAPAAAVQSQAQQADGVQTYAHRALGIAGGEVEHEALGPFLGPALAGAARPVAEVVVEVEVAQTKAGVTIGHQVCENIRAER